MSTTCDDWSVLTTMWDRMTTTCVDGWMTSSVVVVAAVVVDSKRHDSHQRYEGPCAAPPLH